MSPPAQEFDILQTPLAPGLSVIEASAGTGKTYAISHLIPRLLLEEAVKDMSQIVLVTFTNDAAGELADRTRAILERLYAPADQDEDREDPTLHALRKKFGAETIHRIIGRALQDLDRLAVSTIHSFCMSILQTEGVLCGYPVVPELIPDASELLEETLSDAWEECISGHEWAACLAAAESWKLESTLKAIQTILNEEHPWFHPEPMAFPAILKALQDQAEAFPAADLSGLQDLVLQDAPWKSQAPNPDQRQAALEALRNHKDPCALIKAARLLSRLDQCVDRRSKLGRDLAQQIASHPLIAPLQKFVGDVESAEWSLQVHMAGRAREILPAKLTANRQITYEGLIRAVRDALRREGSGPTLAASLRKRFRVALIDESQDTDPAQFEIFRRIFLDGREAHSLILIGDPKQAIYAFRGADVETYLQARDLAEGRVYSLTKTFRAPQPLVQATNAIFQREGSFLARGIAFTPATSGLKDRWLQDPDRGVTRLEAWVVPEAHPGFSSGPKRNAQIADLVATEIVRLLDKEAEIHAEGASPKKVCPGDFAVLVSEHKQGMAVAKALRERKVPAIRAEDTDIMTSDEAREFLSLLRALREPHRTALRRAALATRYLGCTAEKLRPSEADPLQPDASFEKWGALWNNGEASAALHAMDQDAKISLRLAKQPQGERHLTNFRHLCDLLEAASHEVRKDPARLVSWFAQAIADAEGRTDIEERQQQLETDHDAVQIVTMHLAKGLEYPLVFCPFLWSAKKLQGIQRISQTRLARLSKEIPSLGGLPKTAAWDQPSALLWDASLAKDSPYEMELQRIALEDRLRLAYVAITRAQVKAWILAGDVDPRGQASALEWLLRKDPNQPFIDWREKKHSMGRQNRHAEVLAQLAQSSEESLAERPLPEATPGCWQHNRPGVAPGLAAAVPPCIPPAWGFTSFSALTREQSPHAPPEEPSERVGAQRTSANPFLTAPGGIAMGTAIHAWLEKWDFQEVDLAALERVFQAHGLADTQDLDSSSRSPRDSVTGMTAAMLEQLRTARLPGLEASIAQACPNPSASEWHFQLPIRGSLHAQAFADVFAKHGLSTYAQRLAILPARDLQGYLHGFLDRIAFWEGTWGVIDWKTNQLGPTLEDYSPEVLLRCAMESHYLLQVHLYLVALRRFLAPETPIAGAWLVFLRGVQKGTTHGILPIAPSENLLRDLDGLFGGPNSTPPQ